MKVLRKIYFYKLFMKKSKNNSKNNNYLIIHFTKYFMKNLKNIKKVNHFFCFPIKFFLKIV